MKPLTIYPCTINPYDLNEEFRLITYPTVKPNMYVVSNYGRIVNAKSGRIIALPISKTGYYLCGILREDGAHRSYLVHRLVAWEWCPGRNLDLQINHIDGNKLNNFFLNLEWCDQCHNVRHAYDIGLTRLHYGEGTNHKLTEIAVHYCCKLLENADISYKAIINKVKDQFNIQIAVGTLVDIAHGRTWTHISTQYNIPFRNRQTSF